MMKKKKKKTCTKRRVLPLHLSLRGTARSVLWSTLLSTPSDCPRDGFFEAIFFLFFFFPNGKRIAGLVLQLTYNYRNAEEERAMGETESGLNWTID